MTIGGTRGTGKTFTLEHGGRGLCAIPYNGEIVVIGGNANGTHVNGTHGKVDRWNNHHNCHHSLSVPDTMQRAITLVPFLTFKKKEVIMPVHLSLPTESRFQSIIFLSSAFQTGLAGCWRTRLEQHSRALEHRDILAVHQRVDHRRRASKSQSQSQSSRSQTQVHVDKLLYISFEFIPLLSLLQTKVFPGGW